uniref:FBA_2 domain-containing protein n=1 Tax=Steinernema glaseri TaxID=37863 RepID=A0A1I7Z018_9BILA
MHPPELPRRHPSAFRVGPAEEPPVSVESDLLPAEGAEFSVAWQSDTPDVILGSMEHGQWLTHSAILRFLMQRQFIAEYIKECRKGGMHVTLPTNARLPNNRTDIKYEMEKFFFGCSMTGIQFVLVIQDRCFHEHKFMNYLERKWNVITQVVLSDTIKMWFEGSNSIIRNLFQQTNTNMDNFEVAGMIRNNKRADWLKFVPHAAQIRFVVMSWDSVTKNLHGSKDLSLRVAFDSRGGGLLFLVHQPGMVVDPSRQTEHPTDGLGRTQVAH